jgi:hypothetical protein
MVEKPSVRRPEKKREQLDNLREGESIILKKFIGIEYYIFEMI